MKQLAVQELEVIYDTLASTLDSIDEQQHCLFLTKLALLLANQVADVNVVQTAIQSAAVMES